MTSAVSFGGAAQFGDCRAVASAGEAEISARSLDRLYDHFEARRISASGLNGLVIALSVKKDLFVKKSRTSRKKIEFRELWQELRAIALWDRIYESTEYHDLVETSGWEARRKLFREIIDQIISLDR